MRELANTSGSPDAVAVPAATKNAPIPERAMRLPTITTPFENRGDAMRSSSSAAKMPAKHTGAIWFRRDRFSG
jgi:hypothetical protein